MNRNIFQYISLGLFLVYLVVFPGSTITVALDRVPDWGAWMGGALMSVQGLAVICWLLGTYGRRGALAGALAFLMAWGVEHAGETTGWPFGRYQYTEALQPQLFGIVPLPITLAWLMAALGAWQLAVFKFQHRRWPAALLAATLVVALDLQIETVATRINVYWEWFDSGPYYGVPTLNFFGWWLVGLLMALVVSGLLGDSSTPETPAMAAWIAPCIPALLYLLSSLMFTVVNLARGYWLAGAIGVLVLAGSILIYPDLRACVSWPALRQRLDRSQAGPP